MNERNKSSRILSDSALERVMLDVLSGVWEISPERTKQELKKNPPAQNKGEGDPENI